MFCMCFACVLHVFSSLIFSLLRWLSEDEAIEFETPLDRLKQNIEDSLIKPNQEALVAGLSASKRLSHFVEFFILFGFDGPVDILLI